MIKSESMFSRLFVLSFLVCLIGLMFVAGGDPCAARDRFDRPGTGAIRPERGNRFDRQGAEPYPGSTNQPWDQASCREALYRELDTLNKGTDLRDETEYDLIDFFVGELLGGQYDEYPIDLWEGEEYFSIYYTRPDRTSIPIAFQGAAPGDLIQKPSVGGQNRIWIKANRDVECIVKISTPDWLEGFCSYCLGIYGRPR